MKKPEQSPRATFPHLLSDTRSQTSRCMLPAQLHKAPRRGRGKAEAFHRAPFLFVNLKGQPPGHEHTAPADLHTSERPNISITEVVVVLCIFVPSATKRKEKKFHPMRSVLSEVDSMFLTREFVVFPPKRTRRIYFLPQRGSR